MNAQWLAQAIYAVTERVGGLEAVVVLTALAAAATFGLLFLACRANGAPAPLAALATLVALLAAVTNLNPRPQIFAYPLFAGALLVLFTSSRRPWLLLMLPILVAVWTNIHGSFVLGPLLVGLFLAGAVLDGLLARHSPLAVFLAPRTLQLGAAFIASAAAMGVTPYGFGLLRYVLELTNNPIIRNYVTEWIPTSWGDTTGQLYFGTVLVVVLVAHRSRTRLTATEGLLLLGFGLLGLQTVRLVVWWGLAMAPVLARLASGIAVPEGLVRRVARAIGRWVARVAS